MSTENTQQQSAEEAGKIEKAYNAHIKTLVAVLGGKEQLFKKKKLPKDSLSSVVDELMKEEKVKTEAETKEKLKKLLDQHIQMIKDFAKAEAEMVKLKDEKMKEFNKAAQDLFGGIDKIQEKEKEYYKSLGDAASAASTTEQ